MNLLILIDPATDPRWDNFVQNHPFGWICHLSGWKVVLEESFRQMKGHYLALINNKTDDILAALPIFEVKNWIKGNRLVSIPFATLSDPLVLGEAHMEQLFFEAVALAKRVRASSIEIRTFCADFNLIKEKTEGRYFYKHHYLRVDKDLEEIKRSFNYKAVRYEINKAKKSGLKLKVGKSEDDLKIFYSLHIATRKRLGLPPHPYIFLQRLFSTFFPLGMLDIYLAEYDGRVVGGQLYFKFKERVSMEYEVWDRNMKRASPNHFLIWEAIKMAHEGGYKIFDFGRTTEDNTSLMDFKRRWGTTCVDLPYFIYPKGSHRSALFTHASLSNKIANYVFKNSPIFAIRLVGNFFYRHFI